MTEDRIQYDSRDTTGYVFVVRPQTKSVQSNIIPDQTVTLSVITLDERETKHLQQYPQLPKKRNEHLNSPFQAVVQDHFFGELGTEAW